MERSNQPILGVINAKKLAKIQIRIRPEERLESGKLWQGGS
jgi:hypothetical protein